MTTTIPVADCTAGDVYWVDLDPVIGSEQGGRRPALIVSSETLHGISGRILVCPITSNPGNWPTKIVIPPGSVVSGALLTDQIRMVDRERLRRRIGSLSDELVLRVAHRLAAYVGIQVEAKKK